MSDISAEALEKALAKVKQLVPNAGKIEVLVSPSHNHPALLSGIAHPQKHPYI